MRRGQLPILNPCHEDYGAMRGPSVRRFCDKCDKHVHNLSEMTEREAKSLLDGQHGARICVRYRVGTDGQVRFRPEVRRAGFVAVLSLAMAACTGYAEPDTLESPDAAMVCRDASGYAVDCALAGVGIIPDAAPEPSAAEPEPAPEPEPEPEVPAVPEPEEYELMGDIAYEPTSSEAVEPCPIPDHPVEGGVIMGEMLPESPATRRRARRQARVDRRAERRRKRRGEHDMETMGVVGPH